MKGVRVEISKENADFLDEYALTNFGRGSRSRAIDYLINEKRKQLEAKNGDVESFAEQLAKMDDERLKRKKRLTLSIREFDYECLEKIANDTDTSIQHYLTAIMISHLYNERRLLGNEIEILRQSNYQLSRIGVNLNQVARAIHETGKTPQIDIEYLRNTIHFHTETVKELIKKTIK